MAGALAFAASPNDTTDAARFAVQDGLFKIVVTGNKKLRNPAGQLVDFLDDPPTYVASKKLMRKVHKAAARIRKVCAS